MFEGLIEFIEQTVFALVNRITSDEKSGMRQIEAVIGVLLAFAQKNRGMTRVLIGDALVNEDAQLQVRINQLHDRLEAAAQAGPALRRDAEGDRRRRGRDGAREHPHRASSPAAGTSTAKSGFKRDPVELWPKQWRLLMEGAIA